MSRKLITLILAGLLILLLASAVLAAPHAFDIPWWTVDGGGWTFSTGGAYSLGGTVGQPDAGALTGGEYTLNGGFWGGVVVRYTNYLPLILRNGP